MTVSRKTEYALRCVWYLATGAEKTATIAEISVATDVPYSFLAKILQRLVRAGVVASFRGVKGGFRLARRPEETSLYEVYAAMEGARAQEEACAVSRKTCGTQGYCAVHPFWHAARVRFLNLLRNTKAGAPLPTPLLSLESAEGTEST